MTLNEALLFIFWMAVGGVIGNVLGILIINIIEGFPEWKRKRKIKIHNRNKVKQVYKSLNQKS